MSKYYVDLTMGSIVELWTRFHMYYSGPVFLHKNRPRWMLQIIVLNFTTLDQGSRVLLWSEKEGRFALVGVTGDVWHKIKNLMKTKFKVNQCLDIIPKDFCLYIDLMVSQGMTINARGVSKIRLQRDCRWIVCPRIYYDVFRFMVCVYISSSE